MPPRSFSGGPIASAFIDITANTKTAERDVDRFTSSLENDVSRAARSAERSLENAFNDASNEIRRDLKKIEAGDSFNGLADDAESAALKIERALAIAAQLSDEALETIGGADVFAELVVQAEAAGEGIDVAFNNAANRLQGIDGKFKRAVDFTGVVTDSRAAAVEIAEAFSAAGVSATNSLNDISDDASFGQAVAEAEVSAAAIDHAFKNTSDRSRGHFDTIKRFGLTALKGLAIGAGGLVVGLGAATAGLTAFGLNGAAALEQTQIGFEALLGSAEEADAFIRDLQQFAATTPFEFQGLADNARRLLAVGEAAGITRDEILPTLTTIGDLVAVLGAPAESIDRVNTALAQMASKGKLSTEELLQLGEALPGFPVFQALSEGLGLTGSQLQDKLQAGAIDAKTGISALLEAMGQFPGAAGAMAKQSQTLTGLFSTFKDTISLTLVEAFQPLVPAVKDSLGQVTPIIQDVLTGIAPAVSNIATLTIRGLVRLLDAAGPILTGLFQVFSDTFDRLGPIAGDFLDSIAGLADKFQPALEGLVDVVFSVVDVLLQLSGLVRSFTVPVFAALVEALEPVITMAVEMAGELIDGLSPAFEVIGDAVTGLIEVLGEGLLTIFEQIEPLIPELADATAEFVIALAGTLEAVTPLVPLFADLFGAIAKFSFIGLIAGIQAFTTILNILNPAIEFFVGLVLDAAEFLSPFKDEILTVVGVFFAFGNAFSGVGLRIIAFKEIINFLWHNVLIPLGDFLVTTWDAAWEAGADVIGLIVTAAEKVGAAFEWVWHTILEPFVDFLSNAFDNLDGIFDPIITILSGTFSAVVDAARLVWQALVDAFDTAKDSISNLNEQTIQPLIEQIRDILGPAITTLRDLFESLREKVFEVAGSVQDHLGGAWETLQTIWRDDILPTLQTLAEKFQTLWTAVQPVIEQLRSFLAPVLGIIAGIIAGPLILNLLTLAGILIGGLMIAAKAITAAFQLFGATIQLVGMVVDWLRNTVLPPIVSFLSGALTLAINVAKAAWDLFSGAIHAAADLASFIYNGILKPVASFLRDTFSTAINTAKDAWNNFSGAISNVIKVLSDVWNNWLKPVASFLIGFFTFSVGTAAGSWSVLHDAISTVVDILRDVLDAAGDAIGAIGDVASALSDLPGGGIISGIASFFGAEGGIFNRPTPMIIGEAGPEVLIPLSKPARALSLANQSGLLDVLSTAGRGGQTTLPAPSITAANSTPNIGQLVFNVTVEGDVSNERAQEIGENIVTGAEGVFNRRQARFEARVA